MSSSLNPPGRDDRPTGQPDRDRTGGGYATGGAPGQTGATTPTSREVVRAQKEQFGGMKFGACFFGWLTATGTAVLLTGLLAAAGAAFGLQGGVTAEAAAQNAQALGLAGGIALLVVLFIAYLAGGYVAGRMARFSGAKQGVGVWLWALIIAVVVAVLTAIAGTQSNLLAGLNGFQIPVSRDALTTGGIITAVAVVLISLLGAVLGGLAGMRFHRKVDRASLDA
jgi:hypothetical protein